MKSGTYQAVQLVEHLKEEDATLGLPGKAGGLEIAGALQADRVDPLIRRCDDHGACVDTVPELVRLRVVLAPEVCLILKDGLGVEGEAG